MSRRRKKKGKRQAQPSPAPRAATPSPEASPASRPPRRRTVAAVLILGFAGGALSFFYALSGAELEPRRLNVVLVSIDTLRADRLGAYGNETVPTPRIDRLAEEGVVFERAFTSAPVTLPAHVSLFTSDYPMAHGVRDNGGHPLGPGKTTLAEVLASSGYRTGAFVGAFVLDARFGLDQGFEKYGDDLPPGETQRRGEAVLDEALAWMDSVKDERFFAWVHLFDPHVPYDPPEPFKSLVNDPYDGEVAYVDSLVGRLVDWLDERDLTDDTLVVLVADHGESLGEHGELTHGFFLYDATMRVPLVVHAPYEAVSRRRVRDLVRTVDVMPTVLELVGVDYNRVTGRSLVPLAMGERGRAEPTFAYGEATFPAHYGWSELRSIRDEESLFVEAPRPELYDVATDARQETNLAESRHEDVLAYQERLRALEQEVGASAGDGERQTTLDPEVASRLGALGYVGSGTSTRRPDHRAADPKDKVELFNQIREAAALAEANRLAEARDVLKAVLAADPEVLEARNMLASYLARDGRLEPAIEAYRETLKRDPDYAPAVFGLASAYLDGGRPVEALAGLDRMLELEPGNPSASFMKARLLIDGGRFREAIDVLETSRATAETDRGTKLAMTAEGLIGLGELDEATQLVESALAENPSLPSVPYQLGVIREKRGDLDGAMAAYEKELAVAPDNYRAHFDLAKLLAQRGRQDETLKHLERAIEANPRFALGHLYLANLLLDRGELERARVLAERGVELGPEPAFAPLGHFILADVYQRQGRLQDAQREMATAQRLHEALNR